MSSLNFDAQIYFEQLSKSDLSNQVVVVYGSAIGGRTCSQMLQLLSKHGAQLILVDLISNQTKSLELARKCDQVAKHGNRWQMVGKNGKWQPVQRCWCFAIQSPYDHASIANMICTVHDQFERIDSFVFAVSHHQQPDSLIGPGSKHLTENFCKNINEQLMAFTNFIRLLLPSLEKTNGNIINLSTIQALKPVSFGVEQAVLTNNIKTQFTGNLSSSTIQKAMDMLVKCLSLELGPRKVRINSINYLPMDHQHVQQQSRMVGFEVNQQMVDQFMEKMAMESKRLLNGNSDDVAMAVLFLVCNRRSPFLNGINLIVQHGPL